MNNDVKYDILPMRYHLNLKFYFFPFFLTSRLLLSPQYRCNRMWRPQLSVLLCRLKVVPDFCELAHVYCLRFQFIVFFFFCLKWGKENASSLLSCKENISASKRVVLMRKQERMSLLLAVAHLIWKLTFQRKSTSGVYRVHQVQIKLKLRFLPKVRHWTTTW